jgi:hypothetical protein
MGFHQIFTPVLRSLTQHSQRNAPMPVTKEGIKTPIASMSRILMRADFIPPQFILAYHL